MVLNDKFQLQLDSLPAHINTLYLAFSGGIDSTVLLHSLLPYANKYKIIIWHINHGLQKEAQSMEDFARHIAHESGFEFRLNILNIDPKAGNLEAKARDHRYRLFAQTLTAEDAVLTAHHKNDQVETLLLNMLRGSGSSGLRAIARLKSLGQGYLFRPLLNVTRHQIEQYAKNYQLEWIEDPSNKSLNFDRNYLRHEVIPVIAKRWSSAVSQFQRVSELQNESEQLQTELAKIDYFQVKIEKPFCESSCLSVKSLQALSPARKKNMIRYWVKRNNYPVIGFHKIEELLKQLDSKQDATPVIEGHEFQIRLFKNTLYLVNKIDPPELAASYDMPVSGELNIPQINFRQSRLTLFKSIKREDNGGRVSLKFRQSNPSGKAIPHAHRLKRLFQKELIPPWKRSLIPQIYINDELIGLWLF